MEIQNEDIKFFNVTSTFSVGCDLNLGEIRGLSGTEVEYNEEKGKLIMTFPRPPVIATFHPLNKIIITGDDSEEHAIKRTAGRCATTLRNDGFVVIKKFRRSSPKATITTEGKVTMRGAVSEAHAKETAMKCVFTLMENGIIARFLEYRVPNMFGSYTMPFGIRIWPFVRSHRRRYCSAVRPARGGQCHAIYYLAQPKASLTIRHTGNITVAARSEAIIYEAIRHIYPLVAAHRYQLH